MHQFRIEVIAATANPQQLVWAAMHQDYSENFVLDERESFPNEEKAGELIVKHLLSSNRGHFGPLEHPQITFNVGYFPHSMMQQIRTHRVGISFDVQCLAGDTEVTFVENSGTFKKIKIAELYDLWTKVEATDEHPGNYQKLLQKMNLHVLNEDNGFFEIGHLQDVMCSGVKDIYRVTLADAKTLDCTVNHRLFTADGWQTMEEATRLIIDRHGNVESMGKNCFLMCNGLLVTSDRVCQDANNLDQKNWEKKRKIDGNKLKAHAVEIVKVEYLGKQITYDLEIEGQWHNFVANGIVVHNSFRYTGARISDVATGKKDIEEVFYLRPVGYYSDRQGKKYFYSEEQRQQDLQWCISACSLYQERIDRGLSEEHARSLIPFDARQHFVMSCNTRSLMHLLDLRWKKDAQLEAQCFAELLFERFKEWMPAVAQWYLENRAKKAKLSP